MQQKREHKVYIPNFSHKFSGTIRSLTKDNNPYIKAATELAEKNNIPKYAIPNTEIVVGGDNVQFIFKWVIEVESEETDKTVILAYIGSLPDVENKKVDFLPVFVQRKSGIYKTHIFDTEEFYNDYSISPDVIKIQASKEIQYIDGLNIDFFERYSKSLKKLVEDYLDVNASEENIKEFLAMDKVKSFIIEEEAETLSDTAPRDTLLDWFEEFKGRDY